MVDSAWSCAICLGCGTSPVRQLPCGHAFHAACIKAVGKHQVRWKLTVAQGLAATWSAMSSGPLPCAQGREFANKAVRTFDHKPATRRRNMKELRSAQMRSAACGFAPEQEVLAALRRIMDFSCLPDRVQNPSIISWMVPGC